MGVELTPVGGIIFFDAEMNPAEEFPGTTWEELQNDLYITAEEKPTLGPDGQPIGPHTVLKCWQRIT